MLGRTILTILSSHVVTSRCCIHIQSKRRVTQFVLQSYRSLKALSQQKKPKRIGRPRLPKGEAKGRIVPIRFSVDDLKAVESSS